MLYCGFLWHRKYEGIYESFESLKGRAFKSQIGFELIGP
jgi:hypothetical protein